MKNIFAIKSEMDSLVDFEWDARKAETNLRKHRVSFHEAATVFADPLTLTYSDSDHSIFEQRFLTIGTSNTGRLLVVAHADKGETIRVISARRTTARERKQYEEENR